MNKNTTINRISYTIYSPLSRYYHNRQIDIPKDHAFTMREAQSFITNHFVSGAIVERLQHIEVK